MPQIPLPVSPPPLDSSVSDGCLLGTESLAHLRSPRNRLEGDRDGHECLSTCCKDTSFLSPPPIPLRPPHMCPKQHPSAPTSLNWRENSAQQTRNTSNCLAPNFQDAGVFRGCPGPLRTQDLVGDERRTLHFFLDSGRTEVWGAGDTLARP